MATTQALTAVLSKAASPSSPASLSAEVDGALLCAGAVILLVLSLRAMHRRRRLDRAHARAMSAAAKQAKWSLRKAFAVALLIAAFRIWLEVHA